MKCIGACFVTLSNCARKAVVGWDRYSVLCINIGGMLSTALTHVTNNILVLLHTSPWDRAPQQRAIDMVISNARSFSFKNKQRMSGLVLSTIV
jgi:hypothetical protein